MIITDMETWLLDEGDRIYRYVVYRRMFTPYEQSKAFVDESVYEDTHYHIARIVEAVDLGNGEWMLGLRDIDCDWIEYYRLSEIRLSCFECDQHTEMED